MTLALTSRALGPTAGADALVARARAIGVPGLVLDDPTPRASGWRDVLIRTWKESTKDNLSLIAAGVTFYAFLTIVPLLGSLVLVYGLATLGVGLAYPTTSLLTMRLSPSAEIGRNSSALQVGEALTGAAVLAVTGVVFGLSYATDPHTAFVGTLLVAVSVGLLSVLSAARARPAAATRTHRLRT